MKSRYSGVTTSSKNSLAVVILFSSICLSPSTKHRATIATKKASPDGEARSLHPGIAILVTLDVVGVAKLSSDNSVERCHVLILDGLHPLWVNRRDRVRSCHCCSLHPTARGSV